MRQILTSLPYEKRIGLPSAANGLTLTDSVRRTLLTPVADTHLDDAIESAAGRLVRCDEAGSLLVNHDLPGYTDESIVEYLINTNDIDYQIWLQPGYDVMLLRRTFGTFVTDVWIVDSAVNQLIEIPIDVLVRAPGVRQYVYVKVYGTPGITSLVSVHYYR